MIAYVNLGTSIGMKDGLLDAGHEKNIGDKIVERLVAEETYKGKQYQIRSIIQMRRDGLPGFSRDGAYKAFSFKW